MLFHRIRINFLGKNFLFDTLYFERFNSKRSIWYFHFTFSQFKSCTYVRYTFLVTRTFNNVMGRNYIKSGLQNECFKKLAFIVSGNRYIFYFKDTWNSQVFKSVYWLHHFLIIYQWLMFILWLNNFLEFYFFNFEMLNIILELLLNCFLILPRTSQNNNLKYVYSFI